MTISIMRLEQAICKYKCISYFQKYVYLKEIIIVNNAITDMLGI